VKAITDRGRNQRSRAWLAQQQQHVRPWIYASIAAGVVEGLALLAQMGLLAWLVHGALVVKQPIAELMAPVLALLGAAALRALAQYTRESLAQMASTRVRKQVRRHLLRYWELQGPVRLAGHSSATLANQWVEQVEALDGYFARYLPQQWLALLVPLTFLLVVFWLDWLAALFLLVSAPLIPLFMALIGMSAERVSQQHVLEAGRLAGHFLDRVRQLSTLQLFGQVPATVDSVAQAADRYRLVNMRTLRIAFLSSAVLEFFASVAIAVVAMYIGFGLLGYIRYGPSTELTLFSGLFILLLAPEFFQPLRSLAQHYHDRAAALGAASVLAECTAPPPAARPSPGLEASVDALSVRGVSLCYPGRGHVLQDVDLQVQQGEALALTGPSGSGKSSLLHCLAGFIDADAGQISLFGKPPGAVPIAWLGQRPLLIQGSWADNLRLTAPQADAPAMHAALAEVGLGEVLARQPHGLDTPLREGGVGLSGGQAQRLALARVWLSQAQLVLLDEPTASLDPDSETEVIAALARLAATGRTLIMATHQPALMALAGRRLALHDGRLADA